jgi:hypothetical protein
MVRRHSTPPARTRIAGAVLALNAASVWPTASVAHAQDREHAKSTSASDTSPSEEDTAQSPTSNEEKQWRRRMVAGWHPGNPIPDGYHPAKGPKTPLIIAGAATLGAAYLGSIVIALGATFATGDNPYASIAAKEWLYIPLAGTFVSAAQTSSALDDVILVFDGVAQVVGATLLVIGLSSTRTILVRDDVAKLRVLPWLPKGGGAGFGLMGTF